MQHFDRSKYFPERTLGLLAGLFSKIYFSTIKFKLEYEDEQTAKVVRDSLFDRRSKNSVIFPFFHQDDIAFIPVFMETSLHLMISHSKDGEILSSAVKSLGYKTIRGSSSKGGKEVMRHAVDLLSKKAVTLAIAVDGPRGPIYVAKPGATAIAKRTQSLMVPTRVTSLSSHYTFSRSWHKSRLPKPFSRIKIFFHKAGLYSPDELSKKLLSV